MSNLDNLIAKILNDCEEKAKQIIDSANAKAAEILQENMAAAEKEKEQILDGAKAEAAKAAEQITLGKKLQIRDENLKAKQEMIDKVFAYALQKLNETPLDKYWEFVRNRLSAMNLNGEEIIIPSRYNVKNIDELNAFLREKGKKGNLKLHRGKRNIDGGFILLKGGIENNNTFRALLDYYRYELESDVIEKLF